MKGLLTEVEIFIVSCYFATIICSFSESPIKWFNHSFVNETVVAAKAHHPYISISFHYKNKEYNESNSILKYALITLFTLFLSFFFNQHAHKKWFGKRCGDVAQEDLWWIYFYIGRLLLQFSSSILRRTGTGVEVREFVLLCRVWLTRFLILFLYHNILIFYFIYSFIYFQILLEKCLFPIKKWLAMWTRFNYVMLCMTFLSTNTWMILVALHSPSLKSVMDFLLCTPWAGKN